MSPDLIIYALAAAGLVLWLRSIFGARTGQERERPNPFVITPSAERINLDKETLIPPTAQAKIAELASNPTKILSVENKNAENGLMEISSADKNFDIHFFLQGAQDAFVMIVEAFAKGDRETLKDLLADPVYKSFEGAIQTREASGDVMSAEILAMRKAEVTEAKLQNKIAYITVRFTADETTVTHDKNGAVVAGHAERVIPMRDVWTFGRDTRSKDTRWLVYQTRGDADDGIPDA